MLSTSQRISLAMPLLLATMLVLLCAVPIGGGALTYTPNIAWLITLSVVVIHPRAWTPPMAFCIGLLQDALFATPLGSQALLSLLLVQVCAMQAARQKSPPFRLRWLEAAVLLVVWHGLLWALIVVASHDNSGMRHLLVAGLINALWYPLFYSIATRFVSALPHVK